MTSPTAARPDHPRRWIIAVSLAILVLVLAAGARLWLAPTYELQLVYQAVDAYSVDDRTIDLEYTYGSCDSPAQSAVREQSDHRVVVAVTAWHSDGICNTMAYGGRTRVVLDEPLGDRQVLYDTGHGYRPAPRAPTPVSAAGLHGVRLTDLPCPWHPSPPPSPQGEQHVGTTSIIAPWDDGPVRPVTGDITAFWICRWHVGPHAGMGPPVIVPLNDTAYKDLAAALRLPNKPPVAYCTLQGIITPLVIARTTTGDWAVKLPYDGCGRPLRPVQGAITEALR